MWKWVLGLGFRFVVIYLVDLGFAQQLCVCVFFGVGRGGSLVGEAWGIVVGLRHGVYGFGSWWSEAWWLWVCGGWGVVVQWWVMGCGFCLVVVCVCVFFYRVLNWG